MSAKLIVKSGYIKNVTHKSNAVEYAGNKIEAQIKEQVLVWEGVEKPFDAEKYAEYIAYRPSVEKSPDRGHGLFTLGGAADMKMELDRLRENQDSVMWTHIVSLGRADAERTGYDQRIAWQNLVTAKSHEIAKIYNIDPKNLVVNAAYHDKDHHPHMHLNFYSTDRREGIVTDMERASEQLKSLFFNEIFKDDVSYLKAQKTDQRGQLEHRLRELLRGVNAQSYKPTQEVCDRLLKLSVSLRDYKGKNVYAFHKPQIKAQVDEIVEKMVVGDRHMSKIFDEYLGTQRQFIEQYNADDGKIEARLEEFRQRFFHPRAAQRGKPGSGDRAVIHNEVLRFAGTLTEQTFIWEDEPQEKRKPKNKPSRHDCQTNDSGDQTAQKEKPRAPMEEMGTVVYQMLRDSVKQPTDFIGDMEAIHEQIGSDEFATAYAYVPMDHKAEIRELLRRMSDSSDVFRGALQKHLKEVKTKTGKTEIGLDELEEKFFSPGWNANKQLHDTIVRFTKKLEEQRAVINYNGAVFFSLPEAFGDKGNVMRLEGLKEIAAALGKTAPDDVSYRAADVNLQKKVNSLLADILNSKEEIDIPVAVKTALLNPDELTPVGLQNTIVRFAARLEEQKAAHEISPDVFSALSDTVDEDGDKQLLGKLEALSEKVASIPHDELGYRKLTKELQAEANALLADIINSKEEIDIPDAVKAAFLNPDELTPVGLQNSIIRFAARLEEQKAAHEISSDVFSALSDAVDEDGDKQLLGKLEALSEKVASIPHDELGYRKLTKELQAEANALLADIINSKEEIDITDGIKTAILNPDELTPVGLQNSIIRFAARLEEQTEAHKISSYVFFSLSDAVDEDGNKQLLGKLEALSEKVSSTPADKLGYRKLNKELKAEVNCLLAEIMNSKKEIDITDTIKAALLNPDELTPVGLQNSIIRFAARLEEQKAAHEISPDVFSALSDAVDENGDKQLLEKLAALSEKVSSTPVDKLGYRKLTKELQAEVNALLAEIMNSNEEIDIPDAIKAALLNPDELTPVGLQNSIIRFAARLEEQKAAHKISSEVFFSLSDAVDKDGDKQLYKKLEDLSEKVSSTPTEELGYHKVSKELQAEVNALLADILNGKKKIDIPNEVKAALLDPDDLTPVGLQNSILRFAARLEQQAAAHKISSDVFSALSDAVGEDGDKQLLGKLEVLSEKVSSIPHDELGYRKLTKELQAEANALLADIINSKKEIDIPDAVKTAILNPGELTPVGLQNSIVRFAAKLEEHKVETLLRKDLFVALLGTVEKKHPLRQQMLDLQECLKKMPDAGYSDLDKDVRQKINEALSGLLKNNKTAEKHQKIVDEFLHPQKDTPTGLHSTVIKFAKEYDAHVKQNARFKTVYVSKMLVRSCAMALAQMTRENSMYNGYGDDKDDPESRLAERDPKQQWHNYISYN